MIGLLVAVAGLAAIVLGGPSLAGALVRGRLARTLETSIHGTVAIDTLRLSWRGPQTVRGMHVRDSTGAPVAELDVSVTGGLLAFVFGTVDRYEIVMTGAIDVARNASGEINVLDVLEDPSQTVDGPITVPAVPFTLRISDLAIRTKGEDDAAPIARVALDGHLDSVPGGDLAIELTVDPASDADGGAIAVVGRLIGLFDAAGRITPSGATGELDVRGENVPMLGPLRPIAPHGQVDLVHVRVTTDDLAAAVRITAELHATVGDQSGRLDADLSVRQPLTPGGEVSLVLARCAGRLTAMGFPTAILRPILPVAVEADLVRDAGASLDGEVAIDGRSFSLDATTDHARLGVAGTFRESDDALVGDRLALEVTVGSAFAAVLGIDVAGPFPVTIEMTSFTVPAAGDDGFALAALAGTGTIHVDDPVMLDLTEPLTITEFAVSFVTTGLGTRLDVAGHCRVNDAAATFDGVVTGIIDAEGRFDLADARAVGTAAIDALPVEVVTIYTGLDVSGIEPVIGPTVSARLTATTGSPRGFGLETSTGPLELEVGGVITADGTYHVRSGIARLDVGPAVAEKFDLGVRLDSTSRVTLTTEPFDVRWSGSNLALVGDAIAFGIASETLRFHRDAPRAAPVSLEMIDVRGTLEQASWSLALRGKLAVDVLPDDHVGDADFDLRFGPLAAPQGQGHVAFEHLSVPALERALADPPGVLAEWFGDAGRVEIDLTTEGDLRHAQIRTELDEIHGDLHVAVGDGKLVVQAAEITLTLPASALNMLFPAGDESQTNHARFTSTLPLDADIRRLELPWPLAGSDPVDWSVASFDVELRGGPLTATSGDGNSVINDVVILAATEDLSGRLEFTAMATVRFRGDGDGEPDEAIRSRTIEAGATIEGLVGPDGTLSLAQARTAANLELPRVLTRVPDAILDLDGLLVTALGPVVDASLGLQDYAPGSGRITVRITTDGPSRIQGRVRHEGDTIVTHDGEAIRAELVLTPEVCEQLLGYVHPALADICSNEQVVTITMSDARIPLDGDLSKLDGVLRISIGEVDFNAGSGILAPLESIQSAVSIVTDGEARKNKCEQTVPGVVDPIVARIKDGIVTYDQFSIKIGEHDLRYTGSIDLVAQTLDIRTEVPVQALGGRIRQFGVIPSGVQLPVHSYGSFDHIRTDVEFDRLLGRIPDAIFKLLPGNGD